MQKQEPKTLMIIVAICKPGRKINGQPEWVKIRAGNYGFLLLTMYVENLSFHELFNHLMLAMILVISRDEPDINLMKTNHLNYMLMLSARCLM